MQFCMQFDAKKIVIFMQYDLRKILVRQWGIRNLKEGKLKLVSAY
jgi:hypothetical protein